MARPCWPRARMRLVRTAQWRARHETVRELGGVSAAGGVRRGADQLLRAGPNPADAACRRHGRRRPDPGGGRAHSRRPGSTRAGHRVRRQSPASQRAEPLGRAARRDDPPRPLPGSGPPTARGDGGAARRPGAGRRAASGGRYRRVPVRRRRPGRPAGKLDLAGERRGGQVVALACDPVDGRPGRRPSRSGPGRRRPKFRRPGRRRSRSRRRGCSTCR